MIDVQKVEQGGVTVLRLAGDIDEEGVNVLRVALLNCLKEKRCCVVVNLTDVRYVSYMGLGVLVERRGQLAAQGGDLRLTGLNLFLKRTMQMASITDVFQVHDTEALAVKEFKEAA